MDRLRAMEVFVRVVEAGSFTAAARAMKLPRTSATSEIQGLETHLGVQLLHRTTRRVTPTEEGTLYYEDVRRLLGELAEIETRTGRATATARGRVRIEVPSIDGREIVAPAMPAFVARHPEIHLEIGSSDRVVDVIAEGVDCVVRAGEQKDETLVGRRLHDQPFVTCAAPSYLAARGTPSSPADLEGHVFVGFVSGRTGRALGVNWRSTSDRDAAPIVLSPTFVHASRDAGTWIAMAVAGLGIIQTPSFPSVRARIADGELALLMPGWSSERVTSNVLYPKARYLPGRVRLCVDWLVSVYAAEAASAARFISGVVGASEKRRSPRKGH